MNAAQVANGWRSLRTFVLLLFVMTAAGMPPWGTAGRIHAQEPASPAPSAAPGAQASPELPRPETPVSGSDDPISNPRPTSRRATPVVRIGQGHTVLRAGEHAHDVVVILGSATIEGRVDQDVVVVLGTLRLGPTADVGQSAVVAGGSAVVESGARVGRDLVVAGGEPEAPADFRPGSDSVVVGMPGLAGQIDGMVSWLTRGLLWGRLIVPGLAWVWMAAAIFVAVYLVLNLLFERAVRACRQAVVDRPLSTILTGMLVLVLVGPVSFLLSVSVVGVPIVPVLLCGVIGATLIGKIGVTRWIGHSILPESEAAGRLESLRSFAIGTVVILAAYMVPVLGILVWAIGGMFGLGAATLALASGLRRENPHRLAPGAVPAASPAGHAIEPGGEFGATALQASAVEFPADAHGILPDGTPLPAIARGEGGAGLRDLVAMPRAPFLDRLAAVVLDVLLVALVYQLLDVDGGARVFFLLVLAYHMVAWALKGTTVGGIICNLRIVRTDGGPLLFGDALIRGLSAIFSIAALGIGFLWILHDQENQAWHDRFAGTYVVKVPRDWPV